MASIDTCKVEIKGLKPQDQATHLVNELEKTEQSRQLQVDHGVFRDKVDVEAGHQAANCPIGSIATVVKDIIMKAINLKTDVMASELKLT